MHFRAHHTSYYVEGMGECAKARGLNVPLKKSRQIYSEKGEYLTALCNIPPSLCYKRGEGSLVKGSPFCHFEANH